MKQVAGCFLVLGLVAVLATEAGAADAQNRKKNRGEAAKQHMQQQREENQSFRQTLADKTPEERQALIKQQRATQQAENKEFFAGQHDKNRAELEQKLSQNTQMTPEQKAQVLAGFDQKYAEEKAFWEQITNDSSLTAEQKKAAIKAHNEARKEQNQASREQRKADRQSQKAAE